MANPFLSVVIPAFNEQARIISALEVVTGYLSSQHYTWEVLVVDDGSTDDTAKLVSQRRGRKCASKPFLTVGKGGP